MCLSKRNPDTRENPRVHSGSIKIRVLFGVVLAAIILWNVYQQKQIRDLNAALLRTKDFDISQSEAAHEDLMIQLAATHIVLLNQLAATHIVLLNCSVLSYSQFASCLHSSW